MNFCFDQLQNIGFTEIYQPVVIEIPFEQPDDCMESSSGLTVDLQCGSIIVLLLCWTVVAVVQHQLI